MKKIILVFCIIIFNVQIVSSKETRSRFGFYIDLPDNYASINANLDELLKKDSDEIINKDYFNELASGSAKTDLNIEYFFPTKKYDPEYNNIYITAGEGNIKEWLVYDLSEICLEINNMMNGLYGKQLKQYQCKLNPNNIDIKNSPAVYFFEFEGVFRNQRAHLYMLQTSGGFTTFAMACQTQNCNAMNKDLIRVINSRSK